MNLLTILLLSASLLLAEDAVQPKPAAIPVDSGLTSDYFKSATELLAVQLQFEQTLTDSQKQLRSAANAKQNAAGAAYQTMSKWCEGQGKQLDEDTLNKQNKAQCVEKPEVKK